MNNSTLISGALVFAFIVFLAARGRLTAYASILGLNGSGGDTTPSPAGSVGGNPSAPKPSSPAANAAPAASPPPVATTAPAAPKLPTMADVMKNVVLPAGNGTLHQEFSDALQTAATMMAPAGMLGF